MDAQEKLAWDGELSAAVLGRGEDFTLVFLDGPINEVATANATGRGFEYCGVLAVVDGQCHAMCEPHPGAVYPMLHASLAFAQQVAHKPKPEQSGDSVDWLRRLWNLPDTRS